jgi:uncharacterized membrane protein
MIVALFAGVGIGIVIATIILTATSYQQLPERVPLHFGLDGTINMWGPRAAVWLLPAIQVVIATADGLAFKTGAAPGPGLLIADFVLALTYRAQVLIIDTAKSGKEKAEMRGFWFFSLFTLGAVLLLVFITRP